ncbi:hypothetical protein bcgnr5414_65490 [Bacillus cereus]
MSEEKIYDVIIIGAGPAGMTAAVYTSRANLSTLMLIKVTCKCFPVHKAVRYVLFCFAASLILTTNGSDP